MLEKVQTCMLTWLCDQAISVVAPEHNSLEIREEVVAVLMWEHDG